jgi:hypothetical protein
MALPVRQTQTPGRLTLVFASCGSPSAQKKRQRNPKHPEPVEVRQRGLAGPTCLHRPWGGRELHVSLEEQARPGGVIMEVCLELPRWAPPSRPGKRDSQGQKSSHKQVCLILQPCPTPCPPAHPSHTYIHMLTCTHAHTHMCTLVCACTRELSRAHTRAHTHTHVHTCSRHSQMHVLT